MQNTTRNTSRGTPGGGGQTRQEAARARVAAQRAAARRAQTRRRIILALVSVGAILAVIAALVVVKVLGSRDSGTSVATPAPDRAAPQVVAQASGVPASTLDAIGTGTLRTAPTPIPGAPPLTKDGKPYVLYVGADYCPFCAAERWAVVVALSRFGTFDNLGATTSSSKDVFPSTPTFSFSGSSFRSDYLTFEGVETQTNTGAPLDQPTPEQERVFKTFNAPPYVPAQSEGAIPFVAIGGRYLVSGASYDPGVLRGKTMDQIAAALADPSSEIAKGVGGTANALTAAVCDLTKDSPARVCTSKAVTAAKGRLRANG